MNVPLRYSDSDLVAQCQFEESWDHVYKNFIPVSDIKDGQPEGYLVRLQLYVHGPRDSHVLLAGNKNTKLDSDDHYEFSKSLHAEAKMAKKIVTAFSLQSSEDGRTQD